MTGPVPVPPVSKSDIVLTDEIRNAVFAEACEEQGHQIRLQALIGGQGTDGTGVKIEGPNGQLPHLTCTRCRRVWIIMEQPGKSYDEAAASYASTVPVSLSTIDSVPTS